MNVLVDCFVISKVDLYARSAAACLTLVSNIKCLVLNISGFTTGPDELETITTACVIV